MEGPERLNAEKHEAEVMNPLKIENFYPSLIHEDDDVQLDGLHQPVNPVRNAPRLLATPTSPGPAMIGVRNQELDGLQSPVLPHGQY